MDAHEFAEKVAVNPSMLRTLSGFAQNMLPTPATGKAINSAAKPTPGWITANRDAAAHAAMKARSAQPGVVPPPSPAPKNWGRVPTGPTPAAQAQSFFDNATSGGRQRMLGFDPQARPAPAAAPQSWTQLSPAQQQAVQRFYSGGQGMIKTQSAREFGAKLAFNMDPRLLGALGVGGAGALAGGLYGLMNPGDEIDEETGRRRQRNRFGAALSNALLGAGVGGLYPNAAAMAHEDGSDSSKGGSVNAVNTAW